MMTKRIIARLDVKGKNLVKGIHLEGLRVLGYPEDFARHYYHAGADEIFYMDVVASLFGRNSLKDIISQTASNVFIPITVGGGIRSVDDIREALKAGADKVCLNTAVIKDPTLITKASREFGSSTIVVAIESIKQPNQEYFSFIDNGREYTGIESVEWARRVEELGAGEIVCTSVDQEGTGEGFDLELIKKISSAVGIPVVAHGGCGSAKDVCEAINSGASAVAMASILHYEYIRSNQFQKKTEGQGNTVFLESGKTFKKIIPTNISEIKNTLKTFNIPHRSI